MPDTLAPRGKFGVLAPSTNTSVQPEFDAMRPWGVTHHHSRLVIPDSKVSDDASFLGCLHGIARGGGNGFLVALLPIEVFRRSELLHRFGQRRAGIFFRACIASNANGVACLEEFDRRFAIDAKNGVFDFRV